MLILGVKVVALKLFSFAFIAAHLVLFYYTFRRHISPTLFALIMLIISVNSSILYFASQTYSEAMYMFLQSLVIFLFVNAYKAFIKKEEFETKQPVFQWFVVGFFVFLTSLTRNIGIMVLVAMVYILLTDRKFKASLIVIASYIAFVIPFKIYKLVVWHSGLSKGQRPFSEILLKNFYNPAEGYEDFQGMIVRFFENARLYLSKHFMVALGLHDPASVEKNWFVTFLVIALFGVSLYYAFRKNRIMLFVAIYLGTAVSATFFALQQSWDQMRMVVIYFPLMLLLFSWGILQMSKQKGLGFLSLILPFLLVFIFFRTLGQTIDKIKVNQKILIKNLSGNPYYGFTPDWQNFLFMSRWVGENIPDSMVVASRKPSMSFIYSKGRDFFGIYRFPTSEPEKLISSLRARNGDMIVIPTKTFDKSFPPAVGLFLKQGIVAFVSEGSDIYGMFETREPMGSRLKEAIDQYRVPSITTASLLNRVSLSAKQCFAVSPDTLIRNLRKNKVSYIIVASLRANPNMNTGNIINNIQRYLYFVELKYPGILKMVHQIGEETQEPAWLYRIDYKSYNL
jgi:hypothetical protein